MSDDEKIGQDRRTFLKGISAIATAGAAGSIAAACSPAGQPGQHGAEGVRTMIDHVAPKLGKVRFGLIGTGERGSTLLRLLFGIPDADVIAICDTDPVSLGNAQSIIAESGVQGIEAYTGGEHAYRRLLERDDIDAVLIATPWRWHAPMSIDAMQADKHAFV